jgi:hypothetical protein
LWGGAQGNVAQPGRIARLRSGLRLQRCAGSKKTAAAPTKAGAPAQAATQAEDPQVSKLKTALVSTFGFKEVTQDEASWTLQELTKMQGALKLIPAEQRDALKGVTLKRVKVSSCTGGDPAGCFTARVNSRTGDREDMIEIADAAFEADKDIEDTSGAKVREYDLAGKLKTTLPSQRVLLHEVGHAVEDAPRRAAEVARFKPDLEATTRQNDLNKAISAYNTTAPPAGNIRFSSDSKEKAYQKALINAAIKLTKVIDPINALDADAKGAALRKAVSDMKKLVAAAEKAVAQRIKARAALPAGSSAIDQTLEQAEDANLAASKALLSALEARSEVQQRLEAGQKAEKAAQRRITIGTGANKQTLDISTRLAELVALINLKKIDIKNSDLSSYVKDNWPHKPGEVFAELYQMSVSEQEGLKKFDPDVAAFFTSPIGPKGAWIKKVSTWLSARKTS